MFLQKISLTNFRNYSKLIFNFDTPITVLTGDNAQGKSNFLESIYFLATAKSSKADEEWELIKTGSEYSVVEGIVEDKEGSPTQLTIAMQTRKEDLRNGVTKKVKVNGVPKRVIDYSSNLAVILFSPEDINLITSPPSARRSHLDQVISQVDRTYKKAVSDYEGIITRKNKVLKRIKEDLSKLAELQFWSDQQILIGDLMNQKRKEFLDFINQTEKKFGDFHFEYLPSVVTREKLNQYLQKEIDSVSSLIGPHRDDVAFWEGEKNLAKFGSRGEQRTAILHLKIAEVAFVEHTLGSRPLLLLDDIFSELDLAHREHVVNFCNLQQTVITALELDNVLKKDLSKAAIIMVNQGKLK